MKQFRCRRQQMISWNKRSILLHIFSALHFDIPPPYVNPFQRRIVSFILSGPQAIHVFALYTPISLVNYSSPLSQWKIDPCMPSPHVSPSPSHLSRTSCRSLKAFPCENLISHETLGKHWTPSQPPCLLRFWWSPSSSPFFSRTYSNREAASRRNLGKAEQKPHVISAFN